MTAYTGGAMRLKGWQHPVVVDLQGIEGLDRNAARALAITTQPRGHRRPHRQDRSPGGQLLAAGVVSGAGAARGRGRESGKNGFPWQASIGARVLKNEFVPEGRRPWPTARCSRARSTSPGERRWARSPLSLWAPTTTPAPVLRPNAAGVSNMNFEQWLEACGFVLADL
jgi:hypothetical protein